jgi:hypothetical protein
MAVVDRRAVCADRWVERHCWWMGWHEGSCQPCAARPTFLDIYQYFQLLQEFNNRVTCDCASRRRPSLRPARALGVGRRYPASDRKR